MVATKRVVAGRRRRRRWSEAQKALYLARFAKSGLSVEAFLRETDISRSTFARWRRVQPRRSRRDARASFAAVELVPAGRVSMAAEHQIESGPTRAGITMVVRGAAGLETELSGLDRATALAFLRLVVAGHKAARVR
jgi:transposase